MRFYLSLLSFLLLIVSQLHGQAIEFSAYGGYMLSGKSNYYDGQIDVKNGAVFGATLGYDLGNDTQVQFLYNRNSSNGHIRYYRPVLEENYEFDLILEHFHLGIEKSLLIGNETVQPYGAFSLGIAAYTPKNIRPSGHDLDPATRFSMGAGLGVKMFPTERIGIKLQAKMFMPMLFGGVGVFCGSGGCSGGSSFYVPIVHGEFSGGVILRLEK